MGDAKDRLNSARSEIGSLIRKRGIRNNLPSSSDDDDSVPLKKSRRKIALGNRKKKKKRYVKKFSLYDNLEDV